MAFRYVAGANMGLIKGDSNARWISVDEVVHESHLMGMVEVRCSELSKRGTWMKYLMHEFPKRGDLVLGAFEGTHYTIRNIPIAGRA